MKPSFAITVIACVQVASMLVSCMDEPATDANATGGMGGVATGGAGGSTADTGGAGGLTADCLGIVGADEECSVCRTSADEYCAEHDCAMAEYLDVCFHSAGREMVLGCGYRKVTVLDDERSEPPRVVDIWHETSGELLFHYERPESGDGCATVVGEEPECDEYGEDECYIEPCFECLSGCAANMGCLFPDEPFTSCAARAAAICGEGGAGGEGGLGGGAP